MSDQANGIGAANTDTSGQQGESNAGIDLAALAKAMAPMINAAVSDHVKRSSKAQDSAMQSAIEAALAKHAPVPPLGDDDKSKPSPEMSAMRRQLEEMRTQLTSEKQARETAETKRRDDKTRSDLRQSLADAKVRPELVNAALALLYHEGRVEHDEMGVPEGAGFDRQRS